MLTLYSTILTPSKPYHRLGILLPSPTFQRSASILTTALFTTALLTTALLAMALLTVGLLWTGLATTALVRVGETAGLTKVPQPDSMLRAPTYYGIVPRRLLPYSLYPGLLGPNSSLERLAAAPFRQGPMGGCAMRPRV